jgi:hypothetical protein
MIAEREGEGERERQSKRTVPRAKKGPARVEARPSAQARARGMDGWMEVDQASMMVIHPNDAM